MFKGHVATGLKLVWMTYAAIQGHGYIQTQVAAEDHVWVHDSTTAGISVDICGRVATRSHRDVRSLGHHLGPCWWPRAEPYRCGWPVVPRRAMGLTGSRLLLGAMSGPHRSGLC